ncbi:MAG: PHP-associated domain-containing protein [Candidatus Pacebacteria bacterium]|nr:PHP-associated domain-containing protein [Candidatus Paceibacterota bacterium]
MKLKASLHFHTKDDPFDRDAIDYSLREGIDHAASLGFEVLAVTLHGAFSEIEEKETEYAASKGILLIKGIESEIQGRHVLILNCDGSAEKIASFKELETYKNSHPDIFVMAAHPYFGFNAFKGGLEENIKLFDAFELSWFYSKQFNQNKKGEKIAKKYNLPFVATADAHFLEFLDKNYAIVDSKEKTIAAFFEALRSHKHKNITSPCGFFEMIRKWAGLYVKSKVGLARRKLFVGNFVPAETEGDAG